MKFLLTGGGTAGHINPALAIAQIIKKNDPNAQIAFVGVRGGKEEDLVPREGYPLYFVNVKGFERSLSPKNIKALWLAIRSPYAKETKKIITNFAPDIVIGTGGYASWPILACASGMGIPTAVHESNAIPGLAVKRLEKKVDAVWLNFEKTKQYLKNQEKAVFVGNPLRGEFSTMRKSEARKKLGISQDRLMILSFGGSLGAMHLNTAVLEMMEGSISKSHGTVIYHATGKKDFERCKEIYKEKEIGQGGNCFLCDYVYDMPAKMAAADLVICRAGAMTLSELSKLGKAAILVPSPYVANNHQYENAKLLEQAEAAVTVEEKDLPTGALQKETEALLRDSERRQRMEKNILSFSNVDTGRLILKEIQKLTVKKQS